ncbi:MAG: hypothetical protein K6E77_12160 [Lachnospiraceae bacterium]|nr:hypothetical protein [Lachnospiraceae bacterium]
MTFVKFLRKAACAAFAGIILAESFSINAAAAVPATVSQEAATVQIPDYSLYMYVFDPEYYAAKYPEIAAALGSDKDRLYEHFMVVGRYEGRRGSREFDPVWYSKAYPEVAAVCGNNWAKYYDDYIGRGMKAGRDGSQEYRDARLAGEAEAAKVAAGAFTMGPDGNTYFVAQGGMVMKGWICYGGSYYYLDRTTGIMHAGDKENGISLGADGKAVLTPYAAEKIPVMIRARQIAAMISTPADSYDMKLRRALAWSRQFDYILKDSYIGEHRKSFNCTTAHYANNLINVDGKQVVIGGDCYAYASLAAYIITEMNIGDVYVEDDGKHGWLETGGYFYDPGLMPTEKGFYEYFKIKKSAQYRRRNAEKI